MIVEAGTFYGVTSSPSCKVSFSPFLSPSLFTSSHFLCSQSLICMTSVPHLGYPVALSAVSISGKADQAVRVIVHGSWAVAYLILFEGRGSGLGKKIRDLPDQAATHQQAVVPIHIQRSGWIISVLALSGSGCSYCTCGGWRGWVIHIYTQRRAQVAWPMAWSAAGFVHDKRLLR